MLYENDTVIESVESTYFSVTGFKVQYQDIIAETMGEHVYLEPLEFEQKPVFSFFKRIFDIVFSFIAGAILLIPMLIVALLIKLDSKGPAIYSQERVGLNGKSFKMYKFRSMITDAERNGIQWTDVNDNRITRIGRFIRRTRIDELPQLWNIFLGSMSFVGPRPEREVYYKIFEEYIHGFSKRTMVKPGLTGLAQVNGLYELNPKQKVVFDYEYILKRSVLLDLKCLFKTVAVILKNKDSR